MTTSWHSRLGRWSAEAKKTNRALGQNENGMAPKWTVKCLMNFDECLISFVEFWCLSDEISWNLDKFGKNMQLASPQPVSDHQAFAVPKVRLLFSQLVSSWLAFWPSPCFLPLALRRRGKLGSKSWPDFVVALNPSQKICVMPSSY